MIDPFALCPITLEGGCVRLEPLALHHAEALLAAGADETLWRFLPVQFPRNLEDSCAWIDAALREQNAHGSIPFAILRMDDGLAVGSTRYLDIQLENEALEIGWTWLGAAYQRTAINTECKYLLLRFAFERLGVGRTQFKADARNLQSQRAIERIGATHEGVLRRNRRCWDGHFRDTAYYSILREEWPRVKQRLEEMLGVRG